MIKIIHADTKKSHLAAKHLFKEYVGSLGFDLYFQNFDAELSDFPGQYSPPSGRVFLAIFENAPVGCVGLRDYKDRACEMKRLYVKPDFRGMQVGRLLVETVIAAAKEIGYSRMRLDTIPSMKSAIDLYGSFGFKRIAPYRYNPIEGAVYLELDLRASEKIKCTF